MSKLFVLRLTCKEPPANLGKEADLLIAPDHGPWFDRESTWNCPERQVVFFNTLGRRIRGWWQSQPAQDRPDDRRRLGLWV
jgi:hypothetical protein